MALSMFNRILDCPFPMIKTDKSKHVIKGLNTMKPCLYISLALIASSALLGYVKYNDDLTLSWSVVMAPVWLPVAVLGLFIALMSLWESIYFALQRRRNYKAIKEEEKEKYKNFSVLD